MFRFTIRDVLWLMVVVGNVFMDCEVNTRMETKPRKQANERTHESGPHGGLVAEWGGGVYHVELEIDHDAKKATVYVLGKDAKSPAPIKADEMVVS